MKVLITGAFGNLGLMCIEQALALGFEVRLFDLDSVNNRQIAESYKASCEIVFGDIQDAALHTRLVEGVDAIIHNAALLPPATEKFAFLSHEINVTACKRLIHAALQSEKKPLFIYPSSVTVFGMAEPGEGVLTSKSPVKASDNYTQQKIMIEQYLQDVGLDSVILRVGVSVDTRTLTTDRGTFRQLLQVRADNPLEYVHPKDVALAMCQACHKEEARNKVLLIGGGAGCQITQHEFLKTAFGALGLTLPAMLHGVNPFYTHWMDTTQSQQILQFQQHNFANYKQEMAAKLKTARFFIKPLRFILNPLLVLLLPLV
ncbi:MAG: NAD(P)-dependent oxidoreductase [Pseudomonadales bacterium]|nr:NAD(P)-dependent oxidoreductase [Pseudomonadales bacterium]